MQFGRGLVAVLQFERDGLIWPIEERRRRRLYLSLIQAPTAWLAPALVGQTWR